MATDYDTPRNNPIQQPEPPSVESLRAGRANAAAGLGDDVDPLEAELELPGARLDDEELVIAVVPKQADEFTCTGCFLVHHRSQLADPAGQLCRECATRAPAPERGASDCRVGGSGRRDDVEKTIPVRSEASPRKRGGCADYARRQMKSATRRSGGHVDAVTTRWLSERSSRATDWTVQDLLAAKGEATVSVVLPALNEEATVGAIVERIRRDLVDRHRLVDELVVMDSGSTDGTLAVARDAGATVYRREDVLPALAPRPGKGEVLWRSLAATSGQVVVSSTATYGTSRPSSSPAC